MASEKTKWLAVPFKDNLYTAWDDWDIPLGGIKEVSGFVPLLNRWVAVYGTSDLGSYTIPSKTLVNFHIFGSGIERGYLSCYDASNTHIYEYDPSSGFTSVLTYATTARGFQFCRYGDWVIAADRTAGLYKQETRGSSFTALSGSPPKARFVVNFKNYIVAGRTDGTNGKYIVQWSVLDDPDDWTGVGSGSYQFPSEYGPIVGMCVFRDKMYIATSYSIWEGIWVGGDNIFKFAPIYRGFTDLTRGFNYIFVSASDGVYFATNDSRIIRILPSGQMQNISMNVLDITGGNYKAVFYNPVENAVYFFRDITQAFLYYDIATGRWGKFSDTTNLASNTIIASGDHPDVLGFSSDITYGCMLLTPGDTPKLVNDWESATQDTSGYIKTGEIIFDEPVQLDKIRLIGDIGDFASVKVYYRSKLVNSTSQSSATIDINNTTGDFDCRDIPNNIISLQFEIYPDGGSISGMKLKIIGAGERSA